MSFLFAAFRHSQRRWATHKSGGSTQNGRTSQPKYLGFKRMNGATVEIGNIILRQRGTQWHPATGVGMGRDHTLFALRPGRVKLWFDLEKQRRFISVDDGTLGTLHSKNELKTRLKNSIDIPKYLAADAVDRHAMVMQNIADISAQVRKDRQDEEKGQMLVNGRRRFDLIDLTAL